MADALDDAEKIKATWYAVALLLNSLEGLEENIFPSTERANLGLTGQAGAVYWNRDTDKWEAKELY